MDYLDDIKRVEIKILKRFNEICNKYNIRYYLFYGTLLGAIRHKGFIPWDDDIDIVMPRRDYEKFKEICNLEFDGEHELQSWENCDNYPFIFPKIVALNTKLQEDIYTNLNENYGVYMDIFVLDGVSENKIVMWYQEKLYKLLYRIIKLYYIDSYYINHGYKLLQKVIHKMVNIKSIQKKIDLIFIKNDFDKCKFCKPQLGFNKTYYYRTNYFGDCRKELFEGEMYNVPIDTEVILKQTYGNYMELPPEDMRVSHHRFTQLEIDGVKYI